MNDLAHDEVGQSWNWIAVDHIDLSQSEAQKMRRASFDKTALTELTDSVREQGILLPLIVRPAPTLQQDRVELVCGERRLIAAKQLGLEVVPCIERVLDDQQAIEVQIIENMQREGLHPMQEAEAYQQLKKQGREVEDIAALVGKSVSHVARRVKLLDLCDELRKEFYAGRFDAGVALLFARIANHDTQREAFARVASWRKDEPLQYGDTRRTIESSFMLRLAEAPFDTKDETLLPSAGKCATCPKRSGNDRDLFGDIKDKSVCTDVACFGQKRRAAGDRAIAAAKAKGLDVIVGPAAKKVLPYGLEHGVVGFANVKAISWKGDKRMTVAQIVGKDAPRTFIQDPETGDAGEFVSAKALEQSSEQKGLNVRSRGARVHSQHEQRSKAKIENRVRAALYDELRKEFGVKFERADLEDVACALWTALWHEHRKTVADRWPGLKLDTHERSVHSKVAKLDGGDLPLFIRDMTYVNELKTNGYDESKPERLLAAAKRYKVDAAKIRRDAAKPKRAATAKLSKKSKAKK
jgi:ParB/RepB/Spo0J family partition protein